MTQPSPFRQTVLSLVPPLLLLAGCGSGGSPPPAPPAADPYAGSFGILGVFANEFQDFRAAMGFDVAGYRDWAGARMNDLGAAWTRNNPQLIWDFVEPTVGGDFDWMASFRTDDVFAAAARHGIHVTATFHEGDGPMPILPGTPLRNPLDDLTAYQRFVRAAVERYDGDGVDDAPSGIVIKHWQMGNETGIWRASGRSNDEYVRWFEVVAEAARQSDPEASLMLIASVDATAIDPLHDFAIRTLATHGVQFDRVDLHHWGRWDLASSTMTAVPDYVALLASVGRPGVELWSGEHGTYVGTPREEPSVCTPACAASEVCAPNLRCVPRCTSDAMCPAGLRYCDTSTGLCIREFFPAQSVGEQARSLVYRFVVNRALGVRRIFWNNLVAWHCFGGQCGGFFDRLGLVGDGFLPDVPETAGTPRPAYYSYRMLAARTDETVAEPLGEIATEDPAVHVYGYRNRQSGRLGLVAWADAAAVAALDLGGVSAGLTALVTDGAGVPLRTESLPISGGQVTVSLDPDPVWIEEQQ